MQKFLLFIFFTAFLNASAQDLTGIWRGNFNQSNYLRDPSGSRYKFEVQIDQNSTAFSAVTYSYLSTVFYGKATATGKVNAKTQKVYLEELKIVEVRMAGFSSACIMTCFLQYNKQGSEEILEGTYFSMNTSDSSNCGKGTVFLRKVSTSDFYKEPFLVKKEKEHSKKTDKPPSDKNTATAENNKKPNPPLRESSKPNTTVSKNEKILSTDTLPKKGLTEKAIAERIPDKPFPSRESIPDAAPEQIARMKKRGADLVRTIATAQAVLEVSLTDNGTIDNDTVSVFLNDKLVVDRQRLTDNPIRFTIPLEEFNQDIELTLYADNLGDIPPNTSLLLIKDGSKTHEVKLTSTEKTNAVVRFKRVK